MIFLCSLFKTKPSISSLLLTHFNNFYLVRARKPNTDSLCPWEYNSGFSVTVNKISKQDMILVLHFCKRLIET